MGHLRFFFISRVYGFPKVFCGGYGMEGTNGDITGILPLQERTIIVQGEEEEQR